MGVGLDNRAFWLKLALIIASVSGFLLSIKLWVASSRFFPLAPVSDVLPTIPFPVDYVWSGALWVLLGAIIIARRPQKFIWAFVLLAGVLSLWDQNRWQPWFYQYLFMVGALGFYPWGKTEPARQEAVLNTCRLMIGGLYFWSGIQKINVTFIQDVFPWMIEPFTKDWAPHVGQIINLAGYVVPFVETAVGLGLLIPQSRKFSMGLAIAMHVFILLCIGPLGQNWNTIVWPWNIAMIFFVMILFAGTHSLSVKNILFTKNFLFHKFVLILFGIMPLFSFFDLWDSYLSASLYSGNIKKAYVFIEGNVKDKLPAEIQKYAQQTGSRTGYMLRLEDWVTEELGVPIYPEERVFKQIGKRICDYAEKAADVKLIITGRLDWLSESSASTTFDCGTL